MIFCDINASGDGLIAYFHNARVNQAIGIPNGFAYEVISLW